MTCQDSEAHTRTIGCGAIVKGLNSSEVLCTQEMQAKAIHFLTGPISSRAAVDQAHHLAHEAAWARLSEARGTSGLRLPDSLLPRTLGAALAAEMEEGDPSQYKSWKYRHVAQSPV